MLLFDLGGGLFVRPVVILTVGDQIIVFLECLLKVAGPGLYWVLFHQLGSGIRWQLESKK